MKDLQMTAPEELQYAAEQDKIDLSDYMPLVNPIFEEQIIKAYRAGAITEDIKLASNYYAEIYGKGL
jgi:hypothetical protein